MTTAFESAPAEPTDKVATIYDVARVAGVSHQSVSRYMRGLDMRPSTTAKIQKALETVHYRPNLTARALISGRATRIGALTHEVNQVGPSTIIRGATVAAREAGYLLDVITLDMGDVDELSDALQLLTRYELAGILAFASTDSTRAVFEQTDFRVPVVIAAEAEQTGLPADPEHRGIEELVDHLVGLGHRRFLHIAGPETWSAARNRLRAINAELRRHSLPAADVVHGDWSARSGYDTVIALPDDRIPTAIVAANDQMALGAVRALGRRGLGVPTDVSVSGVDDTPEAAYFSPALTTIRLDFATQGRAALRALLARIDGKTATVPSDGPSATLVVRESTGPARRTAIPAG
ncbi:MULTISPECIES: substrate-binding domain-containing protein [Rathayibacter]|uniref:LacI family DNA-binding transcriptional regulator n=1 Tax=Rathayibacter TaxID=33886 RepID=UPI00135858BC|nr:MULTISPECIES: substrate-binding domain-containing protein [Rathayibacter]